MKYALKMLLAQWSPTVCNPMNCSPSGSSVQGILQASSGGSTPPSLQAKVGSHSLLQGIFLTLGSNLGLLPCWQILYHLSHQGKS